MSRKPLLAHEVPTAVVAYKGARAIDARQFLTDAADLAERLPQGKHVLNACFDRYHFSVSLAACLLTERISLLPPTHTPAVIRQLVEFAPDALCITDEPHCTIDLPRFDYSGPSSERKLRRSRVVYAVPQIPVEQTAAIVFTSGSTGKPLPYRKTWGHLTTSVRHGAERLGLGSASHTLIGTVPAQHMYGFENTVLLPLQSANAFSASRPFYPADIAAAVAAARRPRTLITTPVHLRTLLAAGIPLPPLDLIVSATAPLEADVARAAEARFETRLMEIYGSTETGQIATRRTAESATWRLYPDVRLSYDQEQPIVSGGHVEQLTRMCDFLEATGVDEFLMHGRAADQVNVAGKRSSFGYLNTQLNAIPGVVDGAFFLRDHGDGGVIGGARLAAAVVAPGLSAAALIRSLRERIDPVFLPRPLMLVERLPRNATGKLPQQALQSLIERHSLSHASKRPS